MKSRILGLAVMGAAALMVAGCSKQTDDGVPGTTNSISTGTVNAPVAMTTTNMDTNNPVTNNAPVNNQ